jgi:hypothetical protein
MRIVPPPVRGTRVPWGRRPALPRIETDFILCRVTRGFFLLGSRVFAFLNIWLGVRHSAGRSSLS